MEKGNRIKLKRLIAVLKATLDYALFGALGLHIGGLTAILIFFGFGLQHPNHDIPRWLQLASWIIIFGPVPLVVFLRYVFKKRKR